MILNKHIINATYESSKFKDLVLFGRGVEKLKQNVLIWSKLSKFPYFITVSHSNIRRSIFSTFLQFVLTYNTVMSHLIKYISTVYFMQYSNLRIIVKPRYMFVFSMLYIIYATYYTCIF